MDSRWYGVTSATPWPANSTASTNDGGTLPLTKHDGYVTTPSTECYGWHASTTTWNDDVAWNDASWNASRLCYEPDDWPADAWLVVVGIRTSGILAVAWVCSLESWLSSTVTTNGTADATTANGLPTTVANARLSSSATVNGLTGSANALITNGLRPPANARLPYLTTAWLPMMFL